MNAEPPLTMSQQAAVARIAYALESPGAVALVCGPAGTGKTLVLARLFEVRSLQGRQCECRAIEEVMAELPGNDPQDDGVLVVDDAHRAEADVLATLVESWRRRRPRGGLVLAGEGRLLTLVARDARIERAVMLRAAIGAFTLAESRLAVASRLETVGEAAETEALARTIHEIAAGIPAQVIRLADLVQVVSESAPAGRVTPDDVEALHRRLDLQAA